MISLLSLLLSGAACYWTYNQIGLAQTQAEISRQALTSDKRNDAIVEYISSIDKLCEAMSSKFAGFSFFAEQSGDVINVHYGREMDANDQGYNGNTFSDVLDLRLKLQTPSPGISVWFSFEEIEQLRSVQSSFEKLFDESQLYALGTSVEKFAPVYGECIALRSRVITWFQRKDGSSGERLVKITDNPAIFYHTVEAF
uniref:Uncharacterized protein n=1 Tax=Agrobacterium albertimagni TaxID=147266 RepID=A0A7C1NUC2_9HYPH